MLSVDIYSGVFCSRQLKHTLDSSFLGPLVDGQDEPAFILLKRCQFICSGLGTVCTRPSMHLRSALKIVTQPALYCRFETTTWNFTGFRQVWEPCRCFDSRHERHRFRYRFHELDRAIWRAEDSWDEPDFELKAFLSAISQSLTLLRTHRLCFNSQKAMPELRPFSGRNRRITIVRHHKYPLSDLSFAGIFEFLLRPRQTHTGKINITSIILHHEFRKAPLSNITAANSSVPSKHFIGHHLPATPLEPCKR
jgi:hypothetical protein